MYWIHLAIDHWIFHPLHGLGYQFWSGIAGCLSFLGIFITFYRRHNCHVRRCWRLGKHVVSGTSYVVCNKHHPVVPDKGATVHQIQRAHNSAKNRRS